MFGSKLSPAVVFRIIGALILVTIGATACSSNSDGTAPEETGASTIETAMSASGTREATCAFLLGPVAFEDPLREVTVFMDPTSTDADGEAVHAVVEAFSSTVIHVDREAALAEMREMFSYDPSMTASMTAEVVPPSYRLSIDPARAEDLIDATEDLAGVRSTRVEAWPRYTGTVTNLVRLWPTAGPEHGAAWGALKYSDQFDPTLADPIMTLAGGGVSAAPVIDGEPEPLDVRLDKRDAITAYANMCEGDTTPPATDESSPMRTETCAFLNGPVEILLRRVTVFVEPEIDPTARETVRAALDGLSDNLTWVDQEEAFEEFRQLFVHGPRSEVTTEALPPSYRVRVDPDLAVAIRSSMQDLPGVKSTQLSPWPPFDGTVVELVRTWPPAGGGTTLDAWRQMDVPKDIAQTASIGLAVLKHGGIGVGPFDTRSPDLSDPQQLAALLDRRDAVTAYAQTCSP